ncbi:MAG TPA: hypothetical protein VFV38_35385 [Ktedonobacteraceae bacterium]|nr:hypothetical protein [Ktedonobacteraceae bacterium]
MIWPLSCISENDKQSKATRWETGGVPPGGLVDTSADRWLPGSKPGGIHRQFLLRASTRAAALA